MGGNALFSAVYARCNKEDRRDLWDGINHLASLNFSKWILGGDFNIISSHDEKQGGNLVNQQAILEFNSSMIQAGLKEVAYNGADFTWCNNRIGDARIRAILDRILGNKGWFKSKFMSSVEHLNRVTLDHAPLLLKLRFPNDDRPKQFRFQNIWTTHHSFLSVVTRA